MRNLWICLMGGVAIGLLIALVSQPDPELPKETVFLMDLFIIGICTAIGGVIGWATKDT